MTEDDGDDAGLVLLAPLRQMIEVRVADTGRGISPDQRQRFFDRFAQAGGDQARTRGFGLGLTFCRLAVEAHGGKIWIEDGANGVGSQFVFSLPLDEESLFMSDEALPLAA